MATRSYVIPDLDDEDEVSAPNLFAKRAKTDESSITINENIPSTVNQPVVSQATILDTEVATSSPRPTPPSSSSLLVHSRQRGNPLLKHIRQVKWEYSDTILGGADYSMSRSSCALFLSLRYHTLNSNYIYDRLKSSKFPYQLKVLLVQCDLTEPSQALKELARLCLLYDLTLLVSWSDEESARYLETYRIMEGKSADSLMDVQQYASTDYLTKLVDTLTQVKSVNKTDAQTLLHAFGSLKSVLNASHDQLCVCPGLGALKARRLHQAFTQPFKRQRTKTNNQSQTKSLPKRNELPDESVFDDKQQLDLPSFDDEL